MNSTRNPGRIAGYWYLLLVFIGPLRLIYIPGKLFVNEDAAATARNIAAHQMLFRLGMAADLAGAVVLVLLSLAFYRLFERVDRNLAMQALIFGGIMQGLLYLVGVAHDLGALMVVRGAPFLEAFTPPQRDALVLFLLRMRDHLNTAAEVLWGVWLFPLAALVWKSRFVPRFLAVWLVLAGGSWLALCFTAVLSPQYVHQVWLWTQPCSLGEIALTLWLLVRGSRPPASPPTTAAA